MEQTNSHGSLKKHRNSTEELGSFKIIHACPSSGDQTSNASNNKTTSEYKIIHNETRSTNRHKNPSRVWKYFALATKSKLSPGDPQDPPDDRILCMLCYAKGRVHVYQSKTSSSNLWKHLNRKHNIEIPSEKIFAISLSNFGAFEGFKEEHSHEGLSTDDQLSNLDGDENDEIEVKTDDFEDADQFQEEQIIATSLDEEVQDSKTIVKYEACSTNAIFKDIGLAIIEEVAKRPILYEPQTCKSPSIRATKEIMWAEIYDALGEIIQIDRIQKIWKNIRDRYRKIRSSEGEGLDENAQKYKYYNQLRFLDDVATIDQFSDTSLDEPPEKKCKILTSLNASDLHKNNHHSVRSDDYSFLIEQTDVLLSSGDDLDRSVHYIAEEIVDDNKCTVSSSDPLTTSNVYPLEITENNSPKSLSVSTNTSTNFEQIDEFDLFGRLIAKKLRSAPKDRVNLIETKIMQTILENS